MAGQTFTATSVSLPDQPKAVHVGVNVGRASYIAQTTTLSVSDVIQMVKLPEGAVVIDGYISGKIGAVASCTVKAGIGVAAATDGDLLASPKTLSATSTLWRFDGNKGLPYSTPTIAAATYPKYNYATITCSGGSVTASISLQMTVLYVVTGQ